MKLPRRLARTADGRYCEENDPEAAFLVGPAGMEMSDLEANRLGIMAYYVTHSTIAEQTMVVKEVKQDAFEDKAMSLKPTDDPSSVIPPLAPGMHVDHSQRRGGISTEKR